MLQPRLRPVAASTIRICSQTKLGRHLARSYASVHAVSKPQKKSAETSASAVGKDTGIMRIYKPRTPGQRHLKRPINDHLWKGRPYLPLTFPKKGHSKGGRNNTGRVTIRHHGGGVKRRIRTVDFQRFTPGPHVVERIEYDPGRSAHIALLTEQATGRKSYIVAADGMRGGDVVQSYRSGIPQDLLDSMGGIIDPGIMASKAAFRGNCLPLHMVPIGTQVYAIGSQPGQGAVFCRSAGTYGIVAAKDEVTREDGSKEFVGKYVQVRLQSGEVRRISKDACATIGVASNIHYQYRSLGKAGRSRLLNIRPTVRGVAMNTVDHPHGGGRGKTKGNKNPTSPWGMLAKGGFKSRPKNKTNKWVVEPRPRGASKKGDKKA